MPNSRLEPELHGRRVNRRKPGEYFGTCEISLFCVGHLSRQSTRFAARGPRLRIASAITGSWSLCHVPSRDLPSIPSALEAGCHPSVRVAGDRCEWVLTLAAGVLHRQAQAVEAMTG